MFISKVDVEFRAEDGGDLLGDAVVFVKTDVRVRRAVVEAALKAADNRDHFDPVPHSRVATAVQTVSLRNPCTAAPVLADWGVRGEDLDEAVHEAAAAIASGANNGGMEQQIKFLAKADIVSLANEIINRLDDMA